MMPPIELCAPFGVADTQLADLKKKFIPNKVVSKKSEDPINIP
jgi:hypothetical protein